MPRWAISLFLRSMRLPFILIDQSFEKVLEYKLPSLRNRIEVEHKNLAFNNKFHHTFLV